MIAQTRWWLLSIALGIAAAACSPSDGQPPDDTGNDTGDSGDTGDTGGDPDTGKVPPPGSLAQGDFCDQDAWCSSGFCVKVGNGFNEGVCSKRCEANADCDDDSYECMALVGASDDVKGCVPTGLCIDKDGDGYGVGSGCAGQDCDDDDRLVYNGAPEICDGKDNDCDGIIDNRLVDVGLYCETGLEGICSDGTTVCNDGVRTCAQNQYPTQEICNGLDDDCDGLEDEPASLDDNGNFVREIGHACQPAGSTCRNGIRRCDLQNHGGLYCDGLGNDAPEICDGIDNNCDGQIDEGIPGLGTVCLVGEGVCRASASYQCDRDDPLAAPVCNAVPNWANQRDEICNGEDDNCDGTIDDGFINEAGKYHLVEHCNGCGNDCSQRWGAEGPGAVNAVPTCVEQGTAMVCGFTCTGGYVDMDGVFDNGCELLPDTQAIYVTLPAKGGENSASCGDYNRPCATISYGIGRAKSAGRKNVRVSEGVFREGVVVENGISVLGGHSSVNWLRDTTVNTTVVYGAAATFPNDAVAMVARNITNPTEISGLSLTAPDALASGNSIGLFIQDSTNALVVRDNVIQAGLGGLGEVGQAGNAGATGAAGAKGAEGSRIESGCSVTHNKDGGAGGVSMCNSTDVSGGRGSGTACPIYGAATGTPAGTGNNNSGGDFGAPGFSAWGRGYSSNQCSPHPDRIDESFPRDGLAGATGNNGAGGTGASATEGSIQANGMFRNAQGGTGASGNAGGGGGGGGAAHGVVRCSAGTNNGPMQSCLNDGIVNLGASGGGGGAGGCGGGAAAGADSGGSSFSVYILAGGASSPQLTANTLIRGLGGEGGTGGIGGTGANGGTGGFGGDAGYGDSTTNFCAQTGRKGGDGGRGGHGGGGGGGAGGHAFELAVKGLSSAALSSLKADNTFVIPESTDTAGRGGDGGPSMGSNGTSGDKGLFGRAFQLP